MLPKQWLRDYFTFTRKDRIGAFVFIIAVGSFIILPRYLAPKPQPLALQQDSALVMAMDTLQERQKRKPTFRQGEGNRTYQYETSSAKAYTNGELFDFDPNTISLNDWQRLGLNERTSKTILNYVNKGGKFYEADDLLKIWSMPEGFYERVKGHVVITSVTRKTYQRFDEKPRYERKDRTTVTLQINDADTTAFINLPGIGSKLAGRIISFREKLGGFYSVEQIGETYGLPDSTFQLIKGRLQADENKLRKINVNTATKDELKIHPYIRWNLANAIVEYRNQHGAFKNLEELKNIALIDESTFAKVSPYLDL